MWIDDLKQNILGINMLQEKFRQQYTYGEKYTVNKVIKKSYFTRPKLLVDWENQQSKKCNSQTRHVSNIQVHKFSMGEYDYNQPWNKLKYEYKINRIIKFIKSKQLDNITKRILIKNTKNRKIKVDYINGEIIDILNLEELK